MQSNSAPQHPQYLRYLFGSLGRGVVFLGGWGWRSDGERRGAQFHINNLPLRLRIILRYEDTTPRARYVCAFHSWRWKVCWKNCKCNANYESAAKVERIVEWLLQEEICFGRSSTTITTTRHNHWLIHEEWQAYFNCCALPDMFSNRLDSTRLDRIERLQPLGLDGLGGLDELDGLVARPPNQFTATSS